MRHFTLTGILVLSLALVGCGKDDKNPAAPQQEEEQTTAFKFSELQATVFSTSCAFSGCHSTSTKRAGLDLSEGNAYASLVGVNSTQNSSMKRVNPGNSDESYLIRKLAGDGTSQMPLNGTPLSQETLDKIRAWINDGAENN